MGLVLLPIDQDTERAMAQQLVCWARGENGMIDPRVTYQSNASVGDERVGSYLIPGAVCSEYGPVPFTSGGQPIPCDAGPWLHPFFVRRTDVEPIDTNTCRRGGSGMLSLVWEPDAEVMLAVTVTASGAPRVAIDFGDGTTVSAADGESVRHVYAAAGFYTVTASAAERTAAVEAVMVKDHAPQVFVFVDGSDDWRALLWIDEPTSDTVYAVDWDDWSNQAPQRVPSVADYPRIPHQYTHHGYYKIKVTDTGTRRTSVVDFEAGMFGIDFTVGSDNVTPTVTATAMRAGATWQLDWADGQGVRTGTVPATGVLTVPYVQTMPDGDYLVQVRELVDGTVRRGDSRLLSIPWTHNGLLKVTVKWAAATAEGLRPVTITPTSATVDCTVDWGDGSPVATVAPGAPLRHDYQGAPPAEGWLLTVTEPGASPRRYERLIAEPTYVGPPILGAWRQWAVDLHVAGVDDNRGLDTYRIIWGDGTFDNAGATGWWTNARHRYSRSGTYKIKVDGPGMKGQVVQTVTVPNYPTPSLGIREDKTNPSRMTILAQINNTKCGGGVTVDWGDGTREAAADVSELRHTYPSGGQYTVIAQCVADPTAQEQKTFRVPFGGAVAYADIDSDADIQE